MNKKPVETIMGIVVVVVAAFFLYLRTGFLTCKWSKDMKLRPNF